MDTQLLYKIAITQIPKIGEVLTRRLIAYTGSPEAVFKEKKNTLSKIPGIGTTLVGNIIKNNALQIAEKEIAFIDKYNIRAYYFLDDDYPYRLKQCEDSPIIMYVKGNINLDETKIVSVIGTRNASEYGKQQCEKLIASLADNHPNVIITSGLAYGIDICAHKSALTNHLKTAAVLGHGLATIYPAQHRSVAARIIEHGALITDFPYQQAPEPNNFIKRNRIIAGLADATVVIESALKGGALITADIANSYNRDVFALPGKVTETYSTGCNWLIKTNKAVLLENINDLEYVMGWQNNSNKPVQQSLFDIDLPDDEKLVYNTLDINKNMSVDELGIQLQQPVSLVNVALMSLEMKGLVKSLPGNMYKKIK